MDLFNGWKLSAAAFAIASALAVAPASAAKPEGAGEKGQKHQKHEKKQGRMGGDAAQGAKSREGGGKLNVSLSFDDQQRTAVRDYYRQQVGAGRCPPGLAKKRNGCMPPGQAKKWRVGRPLPGDVIFHDLPPDLVGIIGLPPAGNKIVRVGADILMIGIGTGMVIDAIEDLGKL